MPTCRSATLKLFNSNVGWLYTKFHFMNRSSQNTFEFRLTEFLIIFEFTDLYSTRYTVIKYDNFIELFAVIFTFSFI